VKSQSLSKGSSDEGGRDNLAGKSEVVFEKKKNKKKKALPKSTPIWRGPQASRVRGTVVFVGVEVRDCGVPA